MIDGIHIGGYVLKFYGVILMLGALAGGWLATKEAKRRGIDPEIVWDLLIWLIIGGVIGARLWHVFTPSPSALVVDPVTGEMVNPYFAGGTVRFLDILSIWRGGLGIPGAVIGGVVALYFYARRHKLDFLQWLDIGAPSIALGQAIGRFGNLFNQELYGAPTNLPWKLYIDPQHRLPGFESVEYYHPLFAYESLLSLTNMFLLLWVLRSQSLNKKKGDVFLLYLITYPMIRFGLEFLRLDSSQLGDINVNQYFMAVVAVLAALALLWRHRPGQPAVESPADDPNLEPEETGSTSD